MTIDHYEIINGKSVPIWKDAAGYFIFDDSGTLVRTDYSGNRITSGSSVSTVKTSSLISSGAVIAAIAAIAVIFFVTRD